MICLDSTIIIDFLKNKTHAVNAIDKIKDKQLATTTINIFELLLGILRKKQISYDYEIAGLTKLIGNLIMLNLDYQSSAKAAEIASYLHKKGMQIEANDCLIAGIMLANNCNKIITRDEEHFKRIKGIKVEVY